MRLSQQDQQLPDSCLAHSGSWQQVAYHTASPLCPAVRSRGGRAGPPAQLSGWTPRTHVSPHRRMSLSSDASATGSAGRGAVPAQLLAAASRTSAAQTGRASDSVGRQRKPATGRHQPGAAASSPAPSLGSRSAGSASEASTSSRDQPKTAARRLTAALAADSKMVVRRSAGSGSRPAKTLATSSGKARALKRYSRCSQLACCCLTSWLCRLPGPGITGLAVYRAGALSRQHSAWQWQEVEAVCRRPIDSVMCALA